MQNKKSLLTIVPSSGLGERLAFCADKLGGKRALADAALTSESQLFRYISGDSEMSATKAVAIAQAANVDVGWLLTGLGTPEGAKASDPRPPFRAELMEDILKILTEILVDFEWRLNPSQRAKYANYAYMALRLEEVALGRHVTVTPERLMEGLWYMGKSTFDELLKIHLSVLQKQQAGEMLEPWSLNNYVEAIRQGHYQFYNSTGGDAVNRWLGLQVSSNSAERLLGTVNVWRENAPKSLKWLDVGCGNGRELEYVKRHNSDIDVYGVDISRAGLAQCAKFEKAGAWPKGRVQEAEATALPYENNSMGMVYCRSVLYFLPYFNDPTVTYGLALAVKEMVRVCMPGGLICLLTPLNLTQNLTQMTLLTKEMMLEIAAHHGLEVVREREFYLKDATEGYRDQYELILRKPA